MEAPTLSDRFHRYVPRFVTNPGPLKKMSESVPIPEKPSPQPSWTMATKSKSGAPMPQVIGHRGYKAQYPENTMLSFREAVAADADALETDLHLTKDKVVVLSHDASLKRCYDKDRLIADHDWEYVSTLKTKMAPHEPMPRLKDLLEYLAKPEQEDVWVLLDIKMDDDADLIMSCIASTIASVTPSSKKPWNKRIVLGIWAFKYLSPATTHLPDFALTYIGFSTVYARVFLSPRTPNVTFNMLFTMLMIPFTGPQFINDAHAQGRAVYAWTVNDVQAMRWFVEHGVDGVITDDVRKFKDVREAWERGERKISIPLKTRIFLVWIWVLATAVGFWYRPRIEKRGGRGRIAAARA